MQQPQYSPEEDLDEHLQKQEREIHSNLFLLNQLLTLLSKENLSTSDLLAQSKPIINKFKETNPLIAKELENIFASQNRKKIQKYCENEKLQLTELLNDEITKHKEINRQINKEKTEDFPTDS